MPNNTVFAGFTGICESTNNGDTVVRYDQLADRWLVVMPIFRRGRRTARSAARSGRAGDTVWTAPPGVAGQPGRATKLFVPPPRRRHQRDASAPQRARAAGAATPAAQARRRDAGAADATPATGPYSMCYAVSVTSDPLGEYYRYEFLRPLFPDYPRPAVWPDGYYVPTSTSDDFIQKHTCVVDRARMLKGEPATEQCVVIDGVNFLNNADLDGKRLPPAGAPNIILAAGGAQLNGVFGDDGIYVWQFKVDWTNPANTKVTGPEKIRRRAVSVPVPRPVDELRAAAGHRSAARRAGRQAHGARRLSQSRRARVDRRRAFGEHGSGRRRRALVRVSGRARPRSRTVSLRQQGTYAPDGFYRWMASPAIDRLGNIGIGYSFGGTPNFAGQRFAGRLANDPLGVLTLRETVLVEGEAAQTYGLRWEDYTQTAVDPSDDCTIWYVGDYYKKDATNYSTKIGGFRMPGCGRS